MPAGKMMLKRCSRILGPVLERGIARPSSLARPIFTSPTTWNADPSSSKAPLPRAPPMSTPGSSTPSSNIPAPRSVEEARASAWYLDDDPPPSSPSSSSTSSTHKPRFTTFDPSRTTTDSQALPVQPLSPSAPDWLKPLHTYMTGEAGDVLEPYTVSFMPTRLSPALRPEEGEIRAGGGRPGPLWDWVVVGVVKGTGRGVVGRADRAIRKYIRDNPSLGTIERFTNNTRKTSEKFPLIPEDSDWSLIGIPNRRLCINLFTAEGRERWDLEELWTGKSSIDHQIRRDAPQSDMPMPSPYVDEEVVEVVEEEADPGLQRLW